MTDTFDPELFASRAVEGEMATRMEPVPEGEYTALVHPEKPYTFRNPKPGMVILDLNWLIDDPALAENLGRNEVTCRQSIFLDVTESGGLAVGPNKNVTLGRVREALGQNTGKPWSPSMLAGAGPARVLVTHRVNGEDTYDQVSKVVAA